MTLAAKLTRTIVISTVLAAASPFADVAHAEIFVGSNMDERVMLAFRVDESAAQAWLPEPWQVSPNSKGPLKGANLLLAFVDRLLNRDDQGKPTEGGTFRAVVLLVPAKHPESGELAAFVVRIFAPHATKGPYKNSVQATVSRKTTGTGANLEPGQGSETWKVRAVQGGQIALELQFHRDVPLWSKREVNLRSAVDPNLGYLYRYEQLVDFARSVPSNINRVQGIEFRATVPELEAMFDGSEEVIGVVLVPWYARETFRP